MMKSVKYSPIFLKNLRRLLTLMLVACLLPLLPLWAGAEVLERGNLFGSSLVDDEDGIASVALVGDTLYIRTYMALYTFGPEDQRAVKRAEFQAYGFGNYTDGADKQEDDEPAIAVILAHDNKLLGIDYVAQKLYTMTLTGDTITYSEPLALDLSDFMEGEPPFVYINSPAWIKVLGDRLYLRFQNYENKEVDLYSFDLKTGERKEHSAIHYQSAAAYKDGQLVALKADPNNMYDEQTGRMKDPVLVLYNPETDTETALDATLNTGTDSGTFPDIWYDEAQDSLYTFSETDVYRLSGDFKTKTLIGYLPMMGSFWGTLPGSLQGLPGDRLAIAFHNNVFIRPRTEKGKEGITVLTMSGGLDDDGLTSRILMEMDDITLRRVEGVEYSYVNAEQLASMFLTGSAPMDMMAINAYGFDLDKLIQKGYLADLSESPIIKEYLATMAPNLSKSFVKDGKIYCVPGNIMLFPMSAQVKAFEKVGLPIPASITDIVGLAERWMDGMFKEHTEYNLLTGDTNMKRGLKDLVIEKYISNKLGAGEELVFDTPLFRDLMTRIDQIDWQGFDQEQDWSNPAAQSDMMDFWQKTSLLGTNMGFEPRYMSSLNRNPNEQSQPLVLPLVEGQDAYQDADFGLLVVLSTSKNQEAARRFIEQFVIKQHPAEKAAINLKATGSIPNPNHEKELKQLETGLSQLKAQLKKATGAEKSNLEEMLKNTEEYYQLRKETGMYLMTEQEMAAVHAIIARLFIVDGFSNAQRQALYAAHELRDQYFEGAITLDQFIQQTDDKLRLVRMEYQ
ncbi:MAG: extracellular solute-binding protein [Clostridiales bacterium]|nr:extracellular solute-binding protein [Clostridiales bacterium]